MLKRKFSPYNYREFVGLNDINGEILKLLCYPKFRVNAVRLIDHEHDEYDFTQKIDQMVTKAKDY